ncbi:MAG: hypothetical protein R8K47_08450 [Mariprofundaceae bacterium]
MSFARHIDPAIALLALSLAAQMAWFSVMLARRGVPPAALRLATPPLFTLWVVFWPVHADLRWLWVGLVALALPSLLARFAPHPFWRQLRAVWTPPDAPRWEPPLFPTLAGLALAAAWMNSAPEFGFGMALCATLALPAADIADRFTPWRLGFPAHPGQTLFGHLLMILLATILLAWALRVWHHLPWSPILVPTLVAALSGSALRALAPAPWHGAAAVLAMGLTLNLL